MAKGNTKNLIPVTQRSKEEARETSKKGGQQSGKVRRARKLFRDTVIDLLSKPIPNDKKLLKYAESFGISADDDMQSLVIAGLIKKALSGDPKAVEVLRDTAGEKPVERSQVEIVNLEQKAAEIEKRLFGTDKK